MGDESFLLELYASTRWEELAFTGWPDEVKHAFLRQQFQFQTLGWSQTAPGTDRQIILVDGQPGGRLYRDRRTDQQDLRVVDISLLPAYRNRGLGTSLLQTTLVEAHEQGWKVSIHVERANPARRLYERLGFQPVKEGEVYTLMECVPPRRVETRENAGATVTA